MFKKVVFVEKTKNSPNGIGEYKWLTSCPNNFFFYSQSKLEINKWYEIIYYKSNSGVFRLKQSRLIGLSQQLPNITQNIQNIQQNIFIMNDIVEIVNQDYISYFFLAKYAKYATYSCPSSCFSGFFCNNCLDLGKEMKDPRELKSNDYFWRDKTNPRQLVHKKTWMAQNFLK